jgi:hypothetical protein
LPAPSRAAVSAPFFLPRKNPYFLLPPPMQAACSMRQ